MHGVPSILVGLAWVGAVMIELIQSVGEPSPVYAGLLPTDRFAIRLHHFGYLSDSAAHWRSLITKLETCNIPIAFKREGSGLIDVLYADARPMLGHYLEYVLVLPAGKAFLDNVPHNPTGMRPVDAIL
jgi:hypothetical protein